MEVYIFTLFIIFVFGLFEINLTLNTRLKFYLKLLIYIILVIQVGLRWETGTDWLPYFNNFETLDNYNIVLANALLGFEIGYGTFTFIIKQLCNSFSFFLLIHSLIFYFGIFKTIKKYSPYFFISLLFFYATNLGMVGSNRQLLALVICLFGLDYIIKKQFFKFLLIILIASLFHTTSFIFGVYYFLNRNFKKITLFLVLLLTYIIGKTQIPFIIFSKFGGIFGEVSASKTISYTKNANDVLSKNNLNFIGLLKRLIFILIFSINYKYLYKRLNYYILIYNGYVFGLAIYFLFSSSLLILVNRGSLYFNVMESFLLSSQILIFNKNLDKNFIYFIFFMLSIFLLFQSISTYPDLFSPYKGLFYNSDYNRTMY